ncbi:MAG: DJ-1/PfpI family protein [Clostridiales Family XIII bacterium]|jgi:4-methyl-5(b-hydroxyethyl)-thiazole monophosphate biosynthesis|nr:DJ-1/PfpI family protein [Clostridiales Family XIII bacterium]
MLVYVHLADGFEEIEALTQVDLLRRAGVDAKTVSIMGRREVTGAHGVRVYADIVFAEADYDSCEMIVLPGGLPGATNLAAHEGLREKLLDFAGAGKRIAAICASPAAILAPLGILDGKKATGYPGYEDQALANAIRTDGDVVIDGSIITSRGPATAMPFALALVEELCGKAGRDELAGELLFE